MKFSSAALTVALGSALVGKAASQQVELPPGVGNFTYLGAYEVSALVPEVREGEDYYHAGAFIDESNPNSLYFVANAERDYAGLYELKLERDDDAGGQIVNITGPVRKLFDFPEMDHISNKGPDGTYWYSVVASYDPNILCPAAFDGTDLSNNTDNCITIEDWDAVENPNNLAPNFTNLFSINFVPNATEGSFIGTSPEWIVGGQVATTAPYGPISQNQLCRVDASYPGGIGIVPSGSFLGDAMIADYSNDEIYILDLENGLCVSDATGLPQPQIADYTDVKKTLFASLKYVWGFFFDPLTNDFFVTDWSGSSKFYHYRGFVPGIHFPTVIGNIQQGLEDIATAAGGARRRLRQSSSLEKNADTDQKMVRVGGERVRALTGCSGKKSLSRELKSGKKSVGAECEDIVDAPAEGGEPDINPTDIAQAFEDLLASGAAPADVAASVTAPLDAIVNAPSVQDDLLSGGDTTQYLENVNNIATAATSIADSARAALAGDDAAIAIVDAAAATIERNLELMRNAVE